MNKPGGYNRLRTGESNPRKFSQGLRANAADPARKSGVQLFRDIINDLIGYGPIQSLLDDPEISEVMVNGPRNVFVEYKGKLIRTNTTFDNNEHVMRIIQRIVSPLGRQ